MSNNTMKVHDVSRAIRSLSLRAGNLERLANGHVGRGWRSSHIDLAPDLQDAINDMANKQRRVERTLREILANVEVEIRL